jgi:hypothetical protein
VSKKEEAVKEEVETRNCGSCAFYDKSTERRFERRVGKMVNGKRSLIVETRAVCRNEKSPAHGHLVSSEHMRHATVCHVKGEYKTPEKPVAEEPEKKPKKKAKEKKLKEKSVVVLEGASAR